MRNRKFIAFCISVIAVIVGAIFKLDVSVGIGALFATYCVGNVGAKVAYNMGEHSDSGSGTNGE